MENPPSRLPLYVGLVLVACGWAVIFLGWQRAGAQELQTGQIPFLLSGGFGGWGLLLLGVAGVIVDAIQRAAWRTRQTTEAMRQELRGLVDALESRLAPEASEEDVPRRAPRARRAPRSRSTGG